MTKSKELMTTAGNMAIKDMHTVSKYRNICHALAQAQSNFAAESK